MDKEFIYHLLIYISSFGITDNVLNHFKISTQQRIIVYILLFVFTYKFLGTPSPLIGSSRASKAAPERCSPPPPASPALAAP